MINDDDDNNDNDNNNELNTQSLLTSMTYLATNALFSIYMCNPTNNKGTCK